MSRPDLDADEPNGRVDTAALQDEPESEELAALAPLAEALEPRLAPRLPKGTVLAETFEIEGPLGAGGMGIVYRARDLQLGRAVALKLHRPMLRGTDRLMREAASMAKLSHPNVATVHEVGTHEGMLFIAMEFIDGVTARGWVAQTRRTTMEIAALYRGAGEGLCAAHAAGLVHRDFKPENVLVGVDDVARVVDFGLARAVAEETLLTEPDLPSHPPADSSALTLTGAAVGTPAYMPPEQFEGGEVDERSDQFSFCVSLYEAIYGERPFADSLRQHATSGQSASVRPAPAGARVPPKLRRILLRGLALAPADRWPSMELLLKELNRLLVPRSRQWMIASAGLGALGIGGGLMALQLANAGEGCENTSSQLAGIWDERRRTETKSSILATELPYAQDTWERVQAQLDAYATDWATRQVAICEARSDEPQAKEDRQRRLDCMHDRARTLRATVDALAEADADVITNAIAMTSGLPGFQRCDDLEALRAAVPPPEDAAVREEVEGLRDELARIAASKEAGKYDGLPSAVEAVLGRAEALEYAPLVAEAHWRRGALRQVHAEYDAAEDDLLEAHEVAMAHRHDEVALRTAQTLASVVGVDKEDHAAGAVWGRVAVGIAKRNGGDAQIGRSLDSLGRVLISAGQYDEARRHTEQAGKMLAKGLGSDHIELAVIDNNLGVINMHMALYEQAIVHHERALAIRESALGPGHPHVALSLSNLAVVVRKLGRHEEAISLHRRSREIREAALGADHPLVATNWNGEGVAFMGQGEYARAVECYQRAVRIQEVSLGSEHPKVANTLNNLASAFQEQGDYAESRRLHERALKIRTASLGAEHPAVANSLTNLAIVLQSQGHHAEALADHEQAEQVFEKAFGADHPSVATSLTTQASVLEALERYDEAQRRLERALRIQEERLGPEHVSVAVTLHNLGSVLLAAGEFAKARTPLRRSLEIDEAALPPGHSDTAFALTKLAAVDIELGHLETAVAQAEQALEIRETGPAHLRARSQFVLARALWNNPDAQARSRELAELAHAAFTEAGDAQDRRRDEVERWLAEHPARRPR